jgi:Zn-dependent alcohol dehydrogenase
MLQIIASRQEERMTTVTAAVVRTLKAFIPRLVELWKQGRFPVHELIKAYPLGEINLAFADSESGATVKPAVVF